MTKKFFPRAGTMIFQASSLLLLTSTELLCGVTQFGGRYSMRPAHPATRKNNSNDVNIIFPHFLPPLFHRRTTEITGTLTKRPGAANQN